VQQLAALAGRGVSPGGPGLARGRDRRLDCSGEAAFTSTIVSVVYGFSTAIGGPPPATTSPSISSVVVWSLSANIGRTRLPTIERLAADCFICFNRMTRERRWS